MAEKKKETLVLVYDADRVRLKHLAEADDRTMKGMFKVILDDWMKRNG
jgi:hypothetical protein